MGHRRDMDGVLYYYYLRWSRNVIGRIGICLLVGEMMESKIHPYIGYGRQSL